MNADLFTYRIKNGESVEDKFQRVKVFMKHIQNLYNACASSSIMNGCVRVLIVTHSGWIKSLYTYLREDFNMPGKFEKPLNCKVHVFQISGKFQISNIGCNLGPEQVMK